MKISQAGIDLIKYFETLKLERYICPAGKLTIGYGHVILAGENFPDVLTPQEAEAILAKDLEAFEKAVLRAVKVPLEQYQFDALVSFTYNTGELSGDLLRLINTEMLHLAAGQFGRWIYTGKRPLAGLIKRRAAEAMLFINSKAYLDFLI